MVSLLFGGEPDVAGPGVVVCRLTVADTFFIAALAALRTP
jgi:hypothetical protein